VAIFSFFFDGGGGSSRAGAASSDSSSSFTGKCFDDERRVFDFEP
jgi:hypothetical protein